MISEIKSEKLQLFFASRTSESTGGWLLFDGGQARGGSDKIVRVSICNSFKTERYNPGFHLLNDRREAFGQCTDFDGKTPGLAKQFLKFGMRWLEDALYNFCNV